MRHLNTYFVGLVLSAFSLLSCDKSNGIDIDLDQVDDDSTIIGSSKDRPGLGDNDDDPLGVPLVLPEGIRIVERPNHRFNPDINLLYGNVNFFYADINLVNDRMPGTPPVTVEFPPGLVLISMDHDKQNGVSLDRIVLEVPPTERIGGGRDTTTIYIGAACLNKNRSMPWYDNDLDEYHYPIARNNFKRFLVTTDPNLLKFAKLLEDKPKLRLKQHWSPLESHEPDYVSPVWMRIYEDIFEMVWKITDGNGVTKRELETFKQKLEAYR